MIVTFDDKLFVCFNSDVDGSAGIKEEFEHVLSPVPLLRLVR